MLEDQVLAPEPVQWDEELSRRDATSAETPEERLRLVRRLDWRFLVPDPNLKDVAYVGPDSGSLVSALQCFSNSLTIFDSTSHAAESDVAHWDLVVCHNPAVKDVKKAYSILRAGGYLYWEIERRNLGKSRRDTSSSWRHFLAYKKMIKDIGFGDIVVYWHRPDFENCLDIVPLGDNKALGYFFSKDRADLKGRLKAVSGWCLNRSGLMNFLAPCISVVAHRP